MSSRSSDNDPCESKGFIGRWSERKRSHAAPDLADGPDSVPDLGAVPDPDVVAPELGSDQSTATTASTTDEPPRLSDADMPPIESLDASSDVSDFFNRGVSAALRRAALRQIFKSPVYNVRDGLNDYDDDFTVFEPLGDTVTSDMKFHAARKERERLEREAELQAEEDESESASEVSGESSENETVAVDDEHEPMNETRDEPSAESMDPDSHVGPVSEETDQHNSEDLLA